MSTAIDQESKVNAPDFTLTGSQGSVRLADFKGKSKVVLYFLREFACMTCQAHAVSLARKAEDFNTFGAKIIVIGGGTVADAKKMVERFKLPFPVVADPDRAVYAAYNLDRAAFIFQKSATFVIDSNGLISYAHRSVLPAGGVDMNELVSAVKSAN